MTYKLLKPKFIKAQFCLLFAPMSLLFSINIQCIRKVAAHDCLSPHPR